MKRPIYEIEFKAAGADEREIYVVHYGPLDQAVMREITATVIERVGVVKSSIKTRQIKEGDTLVYGQ